MTTAEIEGGEPAETEEIERAGFRSRVLGYSALATLVACVGSGSYIGYRLFDGAVSSNHRDHMAKIDQYQTCEDYVYANDPNHDGIARVKLEDMPQAELQSCGFAGVWDETAKNLTKRHNVLDGWVVNFGLTGLAQLPSRQALEQGISDERQASHDYAVTGRGEGIIGGAFAGGAVWLAGAIGFAGIRVRRETNRELEDEVESGPFDWIGSPPSERRAVYDWYHQE